jgi:hypothetical protein
MSAKTKTRDRVLVDEVRESPVDRELLRGRRVFLGGLLLFVVAVVLVVGVKQRYGEGTGVYATSAGMKP